MSFCEKRLRWNVVNVNSSIWFTVCINTPLVLYYNKNLNNLELIEIVSTNELSTFSYFIKYNSIWSILRSLPQNYISQGGALSFLFYIKQIKLKKIKRGNFGQSDTLFSSKKICHIQQFKIITQFAQFNKSLHN